VVRHSTPDFSTALADLLPDMICRLDLEGNYVYVSPASRTLLGYEPEELIGTSGLALVHPDDLLRISDESEAILGTDVALEMRMRRKDGSWVWTESTAKLVATADGAEILSANRDISDRKRAEDELRASEARFRSAFDGAVVGLFITSLDGEILSANTAMCDLLGRPEHEILGRTFSDLTHPDDVPLGNRYSDLLLAGEIHGARFEKRYVRGDGEAVDVELSVTLLRDASGRPQSFLTCALDLSMRNQAERDAERLMNEFLALASHELRTPLTSIAGYTEMLLDGDDDGDDEIRRHFLEIIQRNGRRLQRLVGDILFAAQLESGGLPFEMGRADLAAIARDAVESAAPRAAELGIEVRSRIDDVGSIDGDADRIAQVIDNLVSNALKFNAVGGWLEVRLVRNDSACVLEVEDSGVGIEPDAVGHLFDRFFRAPGAVDHQGAGLGLAITKAIVDGHGGSIAVASEPGRGSTFRVEFPATG
jgi:PAS domain S-box-containing protein